MQPRNEISLLVTLVATAVLFCAGTVTVILVEPLALQAILLLPLVFAVSASLAAALGWSVGPKLLARNWDQQPRPVRVRADYDAPRRDH